MGRMCERILVLKLVHKWIHPGRYKDKSLFTFSIRSGVTVSCKVQTTGYNEPLKAEADGALDNKTTDFPNQTRTLLTRRQRSFSWHSKPINHRKWTYNDAICTIQYAKIASQGAVIRPRCVFQISRRTRSLFMRASCCPFYASARRSANAILANC